MPRGFKKDYTETAARNFSDPRSFVSLDGHDLLYGPDKGPRRQEIFARDKETCQVCFEHAPEHGPDGYRGEWHHMECEHNNFRRCDCLQAGQVRCGRFVRDCHTKEHVSTQFTKGGVNGQKAEEVESEEK